MIAVLQSNMAFMKTSTFAVALLLGYALVAPPIARSEQTHSDTLIALSADVTLRVIEAGPPNAQSIVLIPGWCFTADILERADRGVERSLSRRRVRSALARSFNDSRSLE